MPKELPVDGDADEGDVEETKHHDQDQRGAGPHNPAQEPAQWMGECVSQHGQIIHQRCAGSTGPARRIQAVGPRACRVSSEISPRRAKSVRAAR